MVRWIGSLIDSWQNNKRRRGFLRPERSFVLFCFVGFAKFIIYLLQMMVSLNEWSQAMPLMESCLLVCLADRAFVLDWLAKIGANNRRRSWQPTRRQEAKQVGQVFSKPTEPVEAIRRQVSLVGEPSILSLSPSSMLLMHHHHHHHHNHDHQQQQQQQLLQRIYLYLWLLAQLTSSARYPSAR